MTQALTELLTLNEYQFNASKTAVYPGRGSFAGLSYVTGKLAGETGEISECVFKAWRDDGICEKLIVTEANPAFPMDSVTIQMGWVSPERRFKLKKELGDALWYISQVAYELGFTLGEVATDNILKLADRQERGVLHGSGDER